MTIADAKNKPILHQTNNINEIKIQPLFCHKKDAASLAEILQLSLRNELLRILCPYEQTSFTCPAFDGL